MFLKFCRFHFLSSRPESAGSSEVEHELPVLFLTILEKWYFKNTKKYKKTAKN